MIAVFVGGSRRISRVNAELAQRLDNIIDRGIKVLIGDASGFDRAAQAYLAQCGYREVLVYCTAGECRNNVGKWPIQSVAHFGSGRGFDFFAAKDDAMLRDADYGLFAWDGKSKGTLRNIRLMSELEKPSAVFVSSRRDFVVVRTSEDMGVLLGEPGTKARSNGDLFSDAG